ncbi:MAG: tetratricopeptide repeat protein [Alphaproteobacteria bacterium]|nr:tetratricopeptide repeat protein [Alphaproteobacteria bacterium]
MIGRLARASLPAFVGAAWFLGLASANPYVPASPDDVVERLQPSPLRARTGVTALRARLASVPGDLETATSLARIYLDAGRRQADERYLGRAKAVLLPWWDAPSPPVAVLALSARIREAQHDFDGALGDLGSVLAARPGDPNALLARANLLELTGRYDEAEASCAPVARDARDATRLVGTACLASINSLRGSAEGSYRLLQSAIGASAPPADQVFPQTVLGEIALRLGQNGTAEAHFRRARGADPANVYATGLLADLLLTEGRAGEVPALVALSPPADPLVMRLAIALRTEGDQGWRALAERLAERFEAARARGDRPHLQSEARFWLDLADNPAKALALAEENWRVQRTPVDARLLVRAAIAADVPAAATPVANWMRSTGLEDKPLAQLVDRARAS